MTTISGFIVVHPILPPKLASARPTKAQAEIASALCDPRAGASSPANS
jgi:hypothetical protein